MSPDLSRRLARAFAIGFPTPAERERVITAAQPARSFEQLPEDVRRLVRRLESE